MTGDLMTSQALAFPLIFGSFAQIVFGTLMFLSALFLILLILVQRGRGGGLAGAFGGMGGQSAFGAKAGDTFTWITIWTSAVWIILCICAVKFLDTNSNAFAGSSGPSSAQTTLEDVERALGTLEDDATEGQPTDKSDASAPAPADSTQDAAEGSNEDQKNGP